MRIAARFSASWFLRRKFFCRITTRCGLLRGELTMPDDAKLLADYVKNGSEDAFRQLVER